MERADLFQVFEFGKELQALTSVQSGDTLAKSYMPLMSAQRALAQLLGSSPQARVDLCAQAARDLKNVIDNIESLHFRDKETGQFQYPDDAQTKQLEPWFVWQIERSYQDFEAVFRAEVQAAATYWVPKRGSYSTRDLVDSFERSFLPDLHDTIGSTALSEYRNAGRCFAFGLWTAAGYHSCRAVEAVLRPYYREFTTKEDREGKTWHALIEGLEAVTVEPKPVDKTLFYLRQLKDNERNPLMHVRVVLDEQDADLLLGAAKIVIVHMAREMIALRSEKAATPLLQAVGSTKIS